MTIIGAKNALILKLRLLINLPSISSTLNVNFFVRMSFFYVHVTREKQLKRRFVQNFFAFNADEIDTYHQFHQRFTQAFFVQNFGAKNHKAKCN